jgi:Tat protein translocase TatC
MALIDRFTDPQADIDGRRLTLGEHLEELRKHVFKCIFWIALSLGLCLCFQDRLMKIATWPHKHCMEELATELEGARASKAGSPIVGAALTELAASDALRKRASRLELNAAVLREKLEADPIKIVDAFAKRREALDARCEALEVEQVALLARPDRLKADELEKKRQALVLDMEAYAGQLKTEIAPLSETDVHKPRPDLIALKYTEGFMAYLKVALVCALFVGSPLIAREIWKFVAAGLYKNEKKYVTMFAPVTFVVFLIGCSFGYFVLIPAGLKFLATYTGDNITGDFQLSEYLSLFLSLTLMVGAIFELPLVMGFLALLGFMTPQFYSSFRRYWLLVAFVLGAIIAPSPDPINQSLCAIPLIILYEIGILFSKWIVKRKKAADEAELAAEAAAASQPSPPISPINPINPV